MTTTPTRARGTSTTPNGAPGRLGRTTFVFLLSTLLLIAVMVVSAGIGAVHYSPAQVLAAVQGGMPVAGASPVAITLWDLRLPRIALAALVGASLAVAGAGFQALLRNDLADPYVVGVSGGASVGAELVLLAHGEEWLAGAAPALAAFVCATLAMTIVYSIARRGGRVMVTGLLLGGVIVSSFLGAISTLLLQLGNPDDTPHILSRLMGSLQSATFGQCGTVGIALIAGLLLLLANARSMNAFSLGEETAQHLGIETERFKTLLVVVGSLLTAATVAIAGIIGFVGLVVPHIARRLAGTPDNRLVLPLSALVGAILMVAADTTARSVMPDGRELPVGLITAFVGGPFFLVLLRTQLLKSA